MLYSEDKLKSELDGVLTHFRDYLKQLRTGRANPTVFEELRVEAYGMENDLRSLANVVVESATSITIQPYDKSIIEDIIKGISASSMGLSPIDEGEKVRVNIPPMTEETRAATVKQMYLDVEDEYKKRIRQIRQDYRQKLDRQEEAPEDQVESAKKKIQTHVDKAISEIESLAKEKEQEIMSI